MVLHLQNNPYRKYDPEVLKTQAMDILGRVDPLGIIELTTVRAGGDQEAFLWNKKAYGKPEWAIEALRECENAAIFRFLSRSPILALMPDEFIWELWEKQRQIIHTEMGRNIYLPQSHSLLENLLVSAKSLITVAEIIQPTIVTFLSNLATNPAVGADLELMNLIMHGGYPLELRNGMSFNPFVGQYPDLVEILVHDESMLVNKGLVANPSMVRYPKYLKAIFESDPTELRSWLRRNPLLETSEELAALLRPTSSAR